MLAAVPGPNQGRPLAKVLAMLPQGPGPRDHLELRPLQEDVDDEQPCIPRVRNRRADLQARLEPALDSRVPHRWPEGPALEGKDRAIGRAKEIVKEQPREALLDIEAGSDVTLGQLFATGTPVGETGTG